MDRRCYEYIYKVYGGDNITGSPITTVVSEAWRTRGVAGSNPGCGSEFPQNRGSQGSTAILQTELGLELEKGGRAAVCETELEDALHLGGGECYEYIYKVYGGDNITGSPITTSSPRMLTTV
jgi:hypothetical protein